MASVCSTFELEFISNKYPDPNYVYDSSVSWMCIYFASVGRATLLSGGVGGREGEGGGGGEVMDDETFVSKESRDIARGARRYIPAYSSASTSSRRHVATDSKETSRVVSEISPGTVPFEIFTRPWARYAKESKSDCSLRSSFTFFFFSSLYHQIFFSRQIHLCNDIIINN